MWLYMNDEHGGSKKFLFNQCKKKWQITTRDLHAERRVEEIEERV